MLSQDTVSVRHEFESFDPFSADTLGMDDAAVDYGDDEPPKQRSAKERTAARRKYIRAPSRDLSLAMEHYIGSLIAEQVPMVTTRNWEKRPEPDCCSPEFLAITNMVNAKHKWVWDAWRTFSRNGLTKEQRAEAARDLEPLWRLRPMRHLIALANDPHKAEDGEIDQAVEQLGSVVPPDLRQVIADVALAIDLCAQVRELAKSADARLYEIYERMIDDEPDVKTLVVNWCRDHKDTDAIYPPGWNREGRKEQSNA